MQVVEMQSIAQLVVNVTGDSSLADRLTAQSRLLGAIPTLDSIAIVNLIVALEKRYDFQVHDDEVEEAIFITLESLQVFVQKKVNDLPSVDSVVRTS